MNKGIIKVKYLVFFLFGITLLVSCGTERRAIAHEELYGVLPCADCAGINVQLSFENQNNYEATILYSSPGASVEKYNGQYIYLNDSMISLNNNELGLGSFLIEEGGLRLLDRENQPIRSSLAERYLLTAEAPRNFTLEPITKSKEATFKAFGVEPNWSLQIDEEAVAGVQFKNFGEQEFTLNTPYVTPQFLNDTIYYNIEVESGAIEIFINKQQCSDGMSDKSYTHKVLVEAKTGKMADYVVLKGCGFYIE